MKRSLATLPLLALALSASAGNLVLWFQQPVTATDPETFLNEALPIGNGRIGALIAGGAAHERLAVNEDSLWTGDSNPSGDYDTMGSYQLLGDIIIDSNGQDGAAHYRRSLDLANALARVSYQVGDVTFSREYFCSHPDHVLVVHLTADKPGAYSGRIQFRDAHQGRVDARAHFLTDRGALSNGLPYEAQLMVRPDGGSAEAEDGAIRFAGCNSLTLILAAGTGYAMDFSSHYRGPDPAIPVIADLERAAAKSFESLKSAHEMDYHWLFDRVSLDLGPSSLTQAALPTDQRKLGAATGFDPELEALLFQYGRYLLISCSRPGGLPANLQGLWNDQNHPAWDSDYHANINIEMNYWPAEPANLAECALPFFDLTDSQLPAWRRATDLSPDLKDARGRFTRRGFALRTSHNIFGGMGWKWDRTANAWYCRHFYEHYAFTHDAQFLKTRALPILKETCEFWEDHLKTLPDGRLVVPHGWSPEHGPEEDGVSYNQEIVWDLFQNYVELADAAGADKAYRNKIAALRDRLATPGVGSWGQLLEWMHEQHNPQFPELDTTNDHHRHTSHLFALYPGRQISPDTTPALARAAMVSLLARGDTGDVREWSYAWRAALFARLKDGQDAHREIRQFFSARNSCPNLFGLHPPMQIDGNFGITAAISEMLLQSQTGVIDLLPALPPDWRDGAFHGLRARGGFEIDAAWKNGRLVSASVKSKIGGPCRLRSGPLSAAIDLPPGAAAALDAHLNLITLNEPASGR